jgi:putative transposase
MARPLRLEYPGALWHVTSRGDGQERIFADDPDKLGFLEVLGEAAAIFRWKVHAYVLMTNHYHLLVETPEPNLSRGMRQLNGIYTQRFNRRHGRVGHVFQGRYKGILVEREAHLLELARYIVLNPVRAGLVKAAKDWTFSNYLVTSGVSRDRPEWLEVAATLDNFGASKARAQADYRTFVAEGARNGTYDPWSQVRDQLLLGSEAFAEDLARRVGTRSGAREIPKRQRLMGRPNMARVIAEIARTFDVSPASIRRPRGGVSREAAAYVARLEGSLSIATIGAALGIQSWSASHLALAGQKRTAEDPGFRKNIDAAIVELRRSSVAPS